MSFRSLFYLPARGASFSISLVPFENCSIHTNTWTIGVSVLTKRIRLCIGHVCSLLDLSLKRCPSGVIVVLWWKNEEKWRNRLIAHLTERRKKEVWLVVPASLERGPYGRVLRYNHFEQKKKRFPFALGSGNKRLIGASLHIRGRCFFFVP